MRRAIPGMPGWPDAAATVAAPARGRNCMNVGLTGTALPNMHALLGMHEGATIDKETKT